VEYGRNRSSKLSTYYPINPTYQQLDIAVRLTKILLTF